MSTKQKFGGPWYLFPFHAANRMMARSGKIDPSWEAKLNSSFGDNSWRDRFYRDDPQFNLFGTTDKMKDASTKELKQYIEERLSTIFTKVSNNSRILLNRKSSPLFLCPSDPCSHRKACGSPRG